ncbi:MAG: hypothetical protein EX285_01440 [Thaumarchaeota archaeon]|nr:hypothetical protein [Nitrososphaerota archaeon]
MTDQSSQSLVILVNIIHDTPKITAIMKYPILSSENTSISINPIITNVILMDQSIDFIIERVSVAAF